MAIAKMTDDQLVDLVANGIKAAFEKEFEKKLRDYAASILMETAKDVAERVTAQVVHYYKVETGQVNLLVKFNEKELV